jgi:hypothetical protein
MEKEKVYTEVKGKTHFMRKMVQIDLARHEDGTWSAVDPHINVPDPTKPGLMGPLTVWADSPSLAVCALLHKVAEAELLCHLDEIKGTTDFFQSTSQEFEEKDKK